MIIRIKFSPKRILTLLIQLKLLKKTDLRRQCLPQLKIKIKSKGKVALDFFSRRKQFPNFEYDYSTDIPAVRSVSSNQLLRNNSNNICLSHSAKCVKIWRNTKTVTIQRARVPKCGLWNLGAQKLMSRSPGPGARCPVPGASSLSPWSPDKNADYGQMEP